MWLVMLIAYQEGFAKIQIIIDFLKHLPLSLASDCSTDSRVCLSLQTA